MDGKPVRSYIVMSDTERCAFECGACGYPVRGWTSDRCPECGQQLRLRVTTATEWITIEWVAFIASCVPAVAMIPDAICIAIRWGPDIAINLLPLWLNYTAMGYGLIGTISLGGCLIWRRQWCRMKKSRQQLLACLALVCYFAVSIAVCVAMVIHA
mgnify:CR=1 FL=1